MTRSGRHSVHIAGSDGDHSLIGEVFLVGHALRIGDDLHLPAARREEISGWVAGGFAAADVDEIFSIRVTVSAAWGGSRPAENYRRFCRLPWPQVRSAACSCAI